MARTSRVVVGVCAASSRFLFIGVAKVSSMYRLPLEVGVLPNLLLSVSSVDPSCWPFLDGVAATLPSTSVKT